MIVNGGAAFITQMHGYKTCAISLRLCLHEIIHSSGEAEKVKAAKGHTGWQEEQLFHLKCDTDDFPKAQL